MKKHAAIGVFLVVCAAEAAGATGAEVARLAFQPAEKGYYAFDTGVLRGKMRLDGKVQGISSMAYVPTGMELLQSVGVFSYYRMLVTGARYGEAIRDWPVVARLLDGGGLEIRFPPRKEHPMEITGTFRWRWPDTLDLQTTVRTPIALPRAEVFLSNYFVDGFDAQFYVSPNRYGKDKSPLFLRADWNVLLDGNYLMFPGSRPALEIMYDGRWECPPNPVTWAFVRYLAAPIGVRRNVEAGLTAVLMSPPEDCFALSASYNKQPPDGVSGHRSLYLSLFGRDLAAGQAAKARCRLIIGKDLSDEAILQRYQQYLKEQP